MNREDTVPEFLVHDITSYPIQFTWRLTGEIPNETSSIVTVIFGRNNAEKHQLQVADTEHRKNRLPEYVLLSAWHSALIDCKDAALEVSGLFIMNHSVIIQDPGLAI